MIGKLVGALGGIPAHGQHVAMCEPDADELAQIERVLVLAGLQHSAVARASVTRAVCEGVVDPEPREGRRLYRARRTPRTAPSVLLLAGATRCFVESVEAARDEYCRLRDASGYGARDWPRGRIITEHGQSFDVAYNGRVFFNGEPVSLRGGDA